MEEKQLHVSYQSENLAVPEVIVDDEKHVTFYPKGVCSVQIDFDIDSERRLHNLQFVGGCNGNTKGIAKLIEGMDAQMIIELLKGNTCGPRPTSCPDQLALALEAALARESEKAAAKA